MTREISQIELKVVNRLILDKPPFVAGSGFINGLFQLLTIKTIGIDSIQLYTGYHSAAYIQASYTPNSPRQEMTNTREQNRDTRHSLNKS